MSYTCVFNSNTDRLLAQHLAQKDFGQRLAAVEPPTNKKELIDALFRTKERLFFAESGDVSGWSLREQLILGGLNIAMPVRIFDNGVWSVSGASVYKEPIKGHLLFTPGPLLARLDCADYSFVVDDGVLNEEKYYQRKVFRKAVNGLAMLCFSLSNTT